jgi:uncharacterized protein (TIGR03792 family)
MIVEMLTFAVEPSQQADWLAVEEEVWSRYLEACPGFIRKEMWRDPDRDHLLHAVIWWSSRDLWKQITAEHVAEVDARMGDWFRQSTMVEYEVVRRS